MKIALDAMGSDLGATPLVEGAVKAVNQYPNCEVILVGREFTLRRLLRYFKYTGDRITIVHCTQSVKMGENPSETLKKKDSSIAVATRLVAEGKADALVSAGNTGSSLAHTLTSWRRLKGISRPGIGAIIPTQKRPCLVLDVGANVDCKPNHLLDFAIMGSVYSREILGRSNPRIGLLSVGEEPTKGNELTLAAFDLLKNSHLNFIGNVEGRHLFKGKVDVIVCDGFVGNVVLKVSEALAKMIVTGLRGAMTKNVLSLAGAMMIAPGMRNFKKKLDHSEYGGAPLLGLNGICIISHGASGSKSIMNAIRVAMESVENRVNERILSDLQKIGHNRQAQSPSPDSLLAGIPQG